MKLTKRLISLLLTLSMLFGLGAQAWAETLTLPSALMHIEEEAFL